MSPLVKLGIIILWVSLAKGQAVSRIEYSALACEGDTMDFVCPESFWIHIESAFWGRADSTTCPRENANNDVRCSDRNVLGLLGAVCEGKRSCSVSADMGYFGDCFEKTAKYLEVEYVCHQKMIDALICENSEKLTLGCPGNERIQVESAFFGREDANETCAQGETMEHDNCSAATATDVFREFCDGRNECTVEAGVDVFGDPCPGSRKYLRLKYACAGCINEYGDDRFCKYWSLLGECSKNPSWMTANCRKSCWKCDAQEPVCENGAGDEECQQFASEGECDSNPAWMLAFCNKACRHCDKKTVCADKYQPDNTTSETCADFQADGQCSENADWMLSSCTASCFECDDHIKCENQYVDSSECDRWAEEGECESNPGWMLPFCFQSCMGCQSDPVCANKMPDADCDDWTSSGECKANSRWMYTNCWKSCMGCEGPPACTNLADNDPMCDLYASEGECQANPAYMMDSCWKSCTGCAATRSTECTNKEGDDLSCGSWSGDGQCVANPTWMFSQCRRACTRCGQNGSAGTYIGRKPMAGDTQEITKANTIVVPDEFPVNGQLTHFSGYFTASQPVYLQIWRPVNGNAEKMDKIYEIRFQPSLTNIVEMVAVEDCVMVSAGDRFGFTSIDGVAPIAHIYDVNNIFRPTAFRDAVSSGNFDQLGLPYAFSINAGYDENNSC